MPSCRNSTPSYRLHKPTRQAVVTLGGRDYYLGRHGSPESRAEYDRLIVEWISNGRPRAQPAAVSDLTINELLLAYLRYADGYYVKNGKPTVEPGNIRLALRPLRALYGHNPAREFGPVALKAVRQAMIDSGLCRSEINRRVGRIVRAIKWAVSEELVPASVHHAIQTVTGLRQGRTEVREAEPVKPVPEAFVEAIEPYVSRQVWAMVQRQLLTGMRPGEVCIMRTADLDTTSNLWVYTPSTQKTEHHGKERLIYLGPQAQAVVRDWLRPELEAYLFAPAEAMAEHRAELRRNRKTPVQPSQRNRARSRPRKKPGEVYDVASYRRSIKHGIRRANLERSKAGQSEIPDWHPHRLRHSAATKIRKEIGLDAARAVLGHSSAAVTEIYAERDAAVAMGAMAKLG